ncbi:hypothetical protein L1987_08261 [Smallanthus sonchifolius]|uniref:Uncharacterized protein n=1 Tax=Smallanthus sonchifolius TaxID=185202 RepID=A0ACB9JM09_9ASTR|nr:hypothetical protein L1987_08261 [Smallanthus sonchifolius]
MWDGYLATSHSFPRFTGSLGKFKPKKKDKPPFKLGESKLVTIKPLRLKSKWPDPSRHINLKQNEYCPNNHSTLEANQQERVERENDTKEATRLRMASLTGARMKCMRSDSEVTPPRQAIESEEEIKVEPPYVALYPHAWLRYNMDTIECGRLCTLYRSFIVPSTSIHCTNVYAEKTVTFDLGNSIYEFSLRQFAFHTGFYTAPELQGEAFATALHNEQVTAFTLTEWWSTVADDLHNKDVQTSWL